MSETTSLSMHAIEMIKSWIGRRDLNKSEVARRLGVSHTWVSNRLAGHQEISLDELEKFATALEVEVGALLPTRDSARAADKALFRPLTVRPTTTINRPRHLPVRCATRPAPTGQTATRQPAHSGHGDRRPAIQPWTHDGVAA